MNFRIFVILSLLIYIINIVKGIEILSSTIVKKQVNVLGVDLSYALIDIEFDKELYKSDSLGCPHFNCTDLPISTTVDCTCDYTDPNNCPKQLPPSCVNKTCELTSYDIELCGATIWETIEFDKEYTYTIDKESQFRIKANSFDCSGVFLKVTPLNGYGDTYIGSTPSTTYQRYSSQYNPQRIALFNICPSDNWDTSLHYTWTESWTRDTYFINISPQSPSFTFTMVLHTNLVPEDKINTSSCPAVPSTDHTCISTNQIVYGEISYDSDPPEQYFSYTVDKAGVYSFNAPCMYQSISYFISDSDSNQKPSSGNSVWSLQEDYDNYMVMYLPASTTLYITARTTYSTNYTFSITNTGDLYKYSLASLNGSVQGGMISLLNTAKLVLENGIDFYNSPTFAMSKQFSVIYPQIDINPLYPVPAHFIGTSKFDPFLISNNITGSSFNSFKPNSFQAAFILSSSTGLDNYVFNQDFDSISNSNIQFYSNLFDENFNPINFNTKLNVKKIPCDNEKFNQVLDLLDKTESVLFNVSDIDELNNYRYSLDMLTISDAWTGCSNSALELLEMESIVKNISAKYCPYKESDSLYSQTPCCNSDAAYYECCNPSMKNVTVSQYIQVNKSLVEDQCFSLDCTSSVLSEYGISIAGIDACTVPDTLPTKLELQSTNVLRDCKSVLIAPTCNSDIDCKSYGNGKCNLFSRTCLPDFQIIDKQYVQCVLSNLSPGTLYSLLVGSTNVNQSVLDKVYNDHLSEDCIGHDSILDRSTYTWGSTVQYTKTDCYSASDCLDESCLTHHDTCLDRIFAFWDFTLDSHVKDCSKYGVCPQLQCDIDGTVYGNGTSCDVACNEIDQQFCGYCTNNETNCNVVPSLTSETACNDKPICLLSNGNHILGLNETECAAQGECSVPCSYDCTSNLDGQIDNVCIITTKNQTECEEMNLPTSGITQWLSTIGECRYLQSTTEQSCITQSYTWIDCQSKDANNGECVGPLGRLSICSLKPIACTTEQECLNAGSCSDSYYFNPITSNNANYEFGMGKCLFKHAYYQTGITCQAYYQNDSPNGCFPTTPVSFTQSNCESVNGTWWVPAKNQNECISQMGCRFLEDPNLVNNIPLNYHFNEMDQSLCEGCYDSFNQWTNKFQWTSANWVPGVYKTTKWLNNGFVSNELNNVFNYQLFYQSVMKSTRAQVADLFRSEAYCRMERLQSNLNSITCSCSGDGGSKCFTSSTPLLGQTKPCSGVNSSYTFNYGSIEFTSDSISQSCQSLSISQISREIYTSTVSESLSSNFVSYKKPDNYGVLNSNSAIIGTLLGDGIMIKSQDGINTAIICLAYKENHQDTYPELDFAVQIDQESKPTPLEFNSSLIYLNITNSQMCCKISNIPRGNPIYFPINRMTNWVDESKESFDKTTKGLMYTLAALFLAIALWGTYELVLIGIAQYTAAKKNFQLTHLLISIVTLFITVRAIYFFIMPSGSLSNSPVSDYILVVLPTFFYFTAFTILLSLWYLIVFIVLKKNRSTENLSTRLYRLVFTINACLYLLFIAIVLVFQYTKSNPTNDCGSRIVIPMESSTPQRAVSIVYAVIQAAISLIIGSAFIYLGGRLFLVMRVSNIKVGSKSNHQRKVFTLTLACSIGFILHCAFVLILVAGNVNSIVFSFIGLIITEMMPAISILYCFDQHHPYKDTSSGSDGSKGSNNNSGNGSGNASPFASSPSSTKLSTFASTDSSPQFQRSSIDFSSSNFVTPNDDIDPSNFTQ